MTGTKRSKKPSKAEMTPLKKVMALGSKEMLKRTPKEWGKLFIRDLATEGAGKLENESIAHRDTSEDGLSYALLGLLQSTYSTASRETDNNGHVDIVLKHPMALANVVLGEAKIYDSRGLKWYGEGLTKLVGKYNAGRNEVALMIGYCRRAKMYEEIEDVKKAMTKQRTADFVRHRDNSVADLTGQKNVFVTEHKSAGTTLTVVHVWVNMYSPLDKTLLNKTTKAKTSAASAKTSKAKVAKKAPKKRRASSDGSFVITIYARRPSSMFTSRTRVRGPSRIVVATFRAERGIPSAA